MNWLLLIGGIALGGLLWHAWLTYQLYRKAKAIQLEAAPLTAKVNELNQAAGNKPSLSAPELAVDQPMEQVLLKRLKLIQRRSAAKAARERRLIENLKKIDPTERRFTRVRKRA